MVQVTHDIQYETLYQGCCLEWLQTFPDECVDLVYIDPPFFTQRKHRVGEVGFDDVFSSMNDYLEFMRERLIELHRVLKPTGSIYVHCDWRTSHHLRLMLDDVFGEKHFRNEIVWRSNSRPNITSNAFLKNKESILYYVKSKDFTFNKQFIPYSKEYIEKTYRMKDIKTGRKFMPGNLRNPNKNRPNLTYEWKGHKRVWAWTKERMEKADREGKLYYSSSGIAYSKCFLDEAKGILVNELWVDIPCKREAIYPTQKPLALLERIIKASSNEGDIVLDAFCGSGTTLHAAHNLKRRWVGIDQNKDAIKIAAKRLSEAKSKVSISRRGVKV